MIYVMSDIHGHMQRFENVMSEINLQPEDTLYILGDVIDREPDGIRILRRIMKMPNVKMLLGNHEYLMLCSLYYEGRESYIGRRGSRQYNLNLWYNNCGKVTHDYLKHIRKTVRQEIFEYLDNLPVSMEVEVNGKQFVLVHATMEKGYNLNENQFHYATLKEYCLWARDAHNISIPDGKTLIFGHTPTKHFQSDLPMSIWHGENRYGIDCGCGQRKNGRLGCLRLDDMKEFYSEYMCEDEIEYHKNKKPVP